MRIFITQCTQSFEFTLSVKVKCASSIHIIRNGHLLSSSYLMRKKFYMLLVVSRFQRLDALEWIRKHPQNRAQSLKNCVFRETLFVVCSGPVLIVICISATTSTGTRGRPDRSLSQVHPIYSNVLTKLRTFFYRT